jgi:hypothetical protein
MMTSHAKLDQTEVSAYPIVLPMERSPDRP